ncbi:MAG: aminoglycoside phosphotransferase family protein [Verrucomicrobiota bacterium]
MKAGLDLEIPVPLALGKACDSFPWPWSIYRWIEGETATIEGIGDLELFAADLASFLNELQRLDGTGGPEPGKDNFFRGGNLSIYDLETRKCLDALSEEIDGDWAGGVWKEALTSRFRGEPVWLHGDMATGNLLTRGGRLAAVIDFGLCAVGDPACDLVLAWNLFEGRSLEVFRRNLRVDESCWTRAKGWALWKALLMLLQRKSPEEVLQAERTLAHLKADSL